MKSSEQCPVDWEIQLQQWHGYSAKRKGWKKSFTNKNNCIECNTTFFGAQTLERNLGVRMHSSNSICHVSFLTKDKNEVNHIAVAGASAGCHSNLKIKIRKEGEGVAQFATLKSRRIHQANRAGVWFLIKSTTNRYHRMFSIQFHMPHANGL